MGCQWRQGLHHGCNVCAGAVWLCSKVRAGYVLQFWDWRLKANSVRGNSEVWKFCRSQLRRRCICFQVGSFMALPFLRQLSKPIRQPWWVLVRGKFAVSKLKTSICTGSKVLLFGGIFTILLIIDKKKKNVFALLFPQMSNLESYSWGVKLLQTFCYSTWDRFWIDPFTHTSQSFLTSRQCQSVCVTHVELRERIVASFEGQRQTAVMFTKAKVQP